MIIGLFTEMLPAGGVQRAGRHVAAVTAKLGAARGFPCHFLSLNDPQGLHTVRVGSCEFSVSGFSGNKSRFAIAALRAAGRQPLLVIALHPHLAPIVWAMKQRSRKFHSVIFAHGIEVWQPLGWPRGPALRRADLVVAPSRYTAQRLISEQGVPPDRVARLPWGLDPEFEARFQTHTQPLRPNGFPEHARVILTVGRWDTAERYKGMDTLISALPNILKVVPDAVLVLVGEGEDRPRLEQLARDLGVSGHTRFLYGLAQGDLFGCYAHCDVFALPSAGEGFGFVFLEAMAHGKPVIGGAHGGIPDVIQDGVTGMLVPHGDRQHLSLALESLLTNPVLAAEMGERARARVQTKYCFEHFQSRLTDVIVNVLDGKDRAVIIEP